MGLLKLLKKKEMQNFEKEVKTEIENWLDNILKQEIPQNIVAFCFNLYDDGEQKWSMELVGTQRFDINDSDWPCDEITDLGTREIPFSWESAAEWNKVLEWTSSILKEYLEKGKYADVLKAKSGVGIGFVDGDIEILYSK